MANFRTGTTVRIKEWSPECRIAPGTLVRIDVEIRTNWYSVFASDGRSGIIHASNLAVDSTPDMFTGAILGETTGCLF
jgi:hypothetical protein